MVEDGGLETTIYAFENLSKEVAGSVDQAREVIRGVLQRRYDTDSRIIDLSCLGADPVLIENFKDPISSASVFAALMAGCEETFRTSTEKAKMVSGVSLARNNLSSLKDVEILADTFPHLINLDLSGNAFSDVQALASWQHKFRNLEHILLTENPAAADPKTLNALLQWYPKLRGYNRTNVRSHQDLARAGNPIPIKTAFVLDEGGIVATFIQHFFPHYDDNRELCLKMFYDQHSKFSYSINQKAMRLDSNAEGHHTHEWTGYLERNRDLTKIQHLSARMTRLSTGQAEIFTEWSRLPRTRHPPFNDRGDSWLIECHPLPGIPDAAGTPAGVQGLIVMAHGEFEELNDMSLPVSRKSFDRTFVLGPGNGDGGIRVVSDIMTLRPYGGKARFESTEDQVTAHAELPPNSKFGLSRPGVNELKLSKEVKMLQVSNTTGMTLAGSQQALEMHQWDAAGAINQFNLLKVCYTYCFQQSSC